MNWLQTLAVLRAAQHDDMHIQSCLKALYEVSLNKKQFYKDKFYTEQFGVSYWENWKFEVQNDLHKKIDMGLARGNGLVIGSCFSGFYLPALSLIKPHSSECLIMQGRTTNKRMTDWQLADFHQKTNVGLKIANVNTESSFALTKHLKRNGIVFVMLDMPLQGMTYDVINFFGYPAITGNGLYKLVEKMDSTILPVYTPRTRDGLSIRAGDLQFGGGYEKLAKNTLKSLEKLIWTDPSKWWMWDYLYERWSAATHMRDK